MWPWRCSKEHRRDFKNNKKGKMKKQNKSVLSGMQVQQPQAWIAVSNNRQKIYDATAGSDKVYLDDGQEFQIELYNPTQTSYVAKIYVNDKSMSTSGLVIKPGQRYFLDRFIDEKKKLIFSTYDVENTKGAKVAIAKNGAIRVEFHSEFTPNFGWNTTGTSTFTQYPSTLTIPANINFRDYGTYSTPISTFSTNNLNYTSTSGSVNSFFCNTSGTFNTLGSLSSTRSKSAESTKSLETGRIERGEKSDQNFSDDNGIYNTYFSYRSEYQILPRSVKPVEVNEIRAYCPGCGSRMKKQNWKFCPTCGGSLD
jgi:hypothetical protein